MNMLSGKTLVLVSALVALMCDEGTGVEGRTHKQAGSKRGAGLVDAKGGPYFALEGKNLVQREQKPDKARKPSRRRLNQKVSLATREDEQPKRLRSGEEDAEWKRIAHEWVDEVQRNMDKRLATNSPTVRGISPVLQELPGEHLSTVSSEHEPAPNQANTAETTPTDEHSHDDECDHFTVEKSRKQSSAAGPFSGAKTAILVPLVLLASTVFLF